MGESKDYPVLQDKNDLTHEVTYQINKTVFVVQPVFKESGEETLGMVLLKLMRSEVEGI